MSDICDAISSLNLVSFHYDGYSRVVEPHTYGIKSDGRRALRAYQVRGGSGSGEYIGWKIFYREKMIDVTVLSESFSGARPKYKRRDSFFSTILCEL